MYLHKIFQSIVNGQTQELHISTSREVYSRDEVNELGYDDFIAVVYINGESRGEISNVLSKAGVWTGMIDDIDWVEEFVSEYHDRLDAYDWQAA